MNNEESEKLEAPIWYYQLSGINWNTHNEIWNESQDLVGALYKVREGVLFGQLISIASVVEGSLKLHLKNKVLNLFHKNKLIKKQIKKIRRRTSPEFITDEELKADLETTEEQLAFIHHRYPPEKNYKNYQS